MSVGKVLESHAEYLEQEENQSLSQPEIDFTKHIADLKRNLSVGPQYSRPSRKGVMSVAERDNKIAIFEAYLAQRAEEIDNGSDDNDYMAQELTIEKPQTVASAAGPTKICKPFFIGRGNPVHDGHEYAMVQMLNMVTEARSNGCHNAIGLILLGSGPNGGERTMDNPITFELKANIIREKLAAKGFKELDPDHPEEGGDYIIQRMTNPARNVSDFVNFGLPTNTKLKVRVIHIAGAKGGDVGKLSFIEKPTRASLPEDTEFEFESKGLQPKQSLSGKDMSATEVRKDAYRSVIDESGYQGWLEKYGDFYGKFAKDVYEEILYPLQFIPEEEHETAIRNYIQTGVLPKIIKRKLLQAQKEVELGGSTRNRRKSKTKKRSNLKKRRTQRKKRRTTRRK
jgi:hypothetical protein